eukprot:m.267737 g.267737  ORF g.267737 m.267737 type:complete len:251 (+) comp40519_c0_seq8:2857-3609(+)
MTYETSSPRYPQSNGLVERAVQTVKGMLKKAIHARQDFRLVLLAYRVTPHETTKVSPARLLMGRQLRTSLPVLSSQLKPQLVTREDLVEQDGKGKSMQAAYYNTRHGVKRLPPLYPGDFVLVWDFERHRWSIPATVMRMVNPRSFVVRIARTQRTTRRNRHQLQLRPQKEARRQEDRWSDAEAADGWDGEANDEAVVEDDDNERNEEDVWDEPEDEEVEERDAQIQGEARYVTRSGRVVKSPVWRRDYVS